MLATIHDMSQAYSQLDIARVPMSLWVVYQAARRRVLFSDRLTRQQEAKAVATVEAELCAAGVPRLPSPRGPVDERG